MADRGRPSAVVDRLTAELNADYGPWLAEPRRLEDVKALMQATANELQHAGATSDVAASLQVQPSAIGAAWNAIGEAMGRARPTLQMLLRATERGRRLWQAKSNESIGNWRTAARKHFQPILSKR
jgi:hypothetical protein